MHGEAVLSLGFVYQKPLLLYLCKIYSCQATIKLKHLGKDEIGSNCEQMTPGFPVRLVVQIPDVSGSKVGLFSSLGSSLMSPPPFTSSDTHFYQTDIPANRNLPPISTG